MVAPRVPPEPRTILPRNQVHTHSHMSRLVVLFVPCLVVFSVGLCWVPLGLGLSWLGLAWVELCWVELCLWWVGLGCVCVGLGCVCVGLGWVGL